MPYKDKDINREYQREWARKNRGEMSKRRSARRSLIKEMVREWKSGLSCSVCGYNRCPEALQFHHRDPATKSFGITKGVTMRYSLDKLKEEAMKCDVLCSNCHAEVHYL